MGVKKQKSILIIVASVLMCALIIYVGFFTGSPALTVYTEGDKAKAADNTLAVTQTGESATESEIVFTGLININTGSFQELMNLEGVGKVKAQAIIDYRQENGAFYSVEDLIKVKGIGAKTMEKLRGHVTV